MSKSAFQEFLASSPKAIIQRSSFKRDHKLTTAIFDDYLVPIQVEEIYPGDTINIGVNSFVRMNPTVTPLMDNVHMDCHYFFVPNRLVWENWERFNGQQDDPGDSTDFLIPQLNPLGSTSLGSLADYFGLPIDMPNNNEKVNALPFRAYGAIFNSWYRDQNLQDSLVIPKGDGPDDIATSPWMGSPPQLSNKRHDYFTSCLPWPQKGPSIPIPTVSSLPVTGIGKSTQTWANGPANAYETEGTGTTQYDKYSSFNHSSSDATWYAEEDPSNPGFPNLRVNLNDNTDATINALRQAFSLQRLYERDARGGTRYTEIIFSHFGVTSPDSRLMRPEYLGGNSQMIHMHPLAQTSEDGSTPQGNLTGNGSLVGTGLRISKSFTEHGYVIGLVRFRGDTSYSQGIDRHWSYQSRWDMYWPELQNIGEQAVLKKELVYTGVQATDDQVFGYNERYSHLKYKKNYLTNVMRPDVTGSTSYWHLSQELAAATLNSDFITSQTPFDRVLAVPTEPTFLCDFFFNFNHTRPMGTHSIPGGLTRL